MNEKIIKCFDNFQIADLDDDMVGMYKALVDWMVEIRRQLPDAEYPDAEAPANYCKLDPHEPRLELRRNYQKLLAHSVKYQKEEDEIIKLLNLYVSVLAGFYIYHMPIDKAVELSKQGTEITREVSQELLLADNMSPNWLKDPSGRDFTAIML